jgi:thiosulfate dehydrogenase [quinone] large subunit
MPPSPAPRRTRTEQQRRYDRQAGLVPSGPADSALRSRYPAIAILPLRLFLGITFAYAAIQKINDPGFCTPDRPPILGPRCWPVAVHRSSVPAPPWRMPAPLASSPATEGSIGLLILLGLFTRPAALVV